MDAKIHNGSLVRVNSQRQVYVLMNGMRVGIPSLAVLVKYGWNLSDVIVVNDFAQLDFLPVSKKKLV